MCLRRGLSAYDVLWADQALSLGSTRTVAKSRTTNVASSSSRGADRFVAVDLSLASLNSHAHGHCIGMREVKGVKHEQGEMRIRAHTFFFRAKSEQIAVSRLALRA